MRIFFTVVQQSMLLRHRVDYKTDGDSTLNTTTHDIYTDTHTQTHTERDVKEKLK